MTRTTVRVSHPRTGCCGASELAGGAGTSAKPTLRRTTLGHVLSERQGGHLVTWSGSPFIYLFYGAETIGNPFYTNDQHLI